MSKFESFFWFGGTFPGKRLQSNELAHQIAKNLHGWRELKIHNNVLDHKGLLAILDVCLTLQIIYLRNCRFLKFEDDLKASLDKIKVKCFHYGDYEYADFDANADFDYLYFVDHFRNHWQCIG